MKQPKKRTNSLSESLEESRIKALEKSFNALIESGPEYWAQHYTLSGQDKILQLERMRVHFQEIEEYEKCQYIIDLKKSLDSYKYLL
tara:strand:- start:889 stop:1149 length:261 start_codon:yes stop_codon:yes gene_type:complete